MSGAEGEVATVCQRHRPGYLHLMQWAVGLPDREDETRTKARRKSQDAFSDIPQGGGRRPLVRRARCPADLEMGRGEGSGLPLSLIDALTINTDHSMGTGQADPIHPRDAVGGAKHGDQLGHHAGD